MPGKFRVYRARSSVCDLPAISFASVLQNDIYNAFGGVAVPEFRRARWLPSSVEDVAKSLEYPPRIRTCHDIGSVCDGDRTFRIMAQCQAGNTQDRCFFLLTAG